MLPIDYLPGARRDFDESFDWYVARSPLAALRFVNAVEQALTDNRYNKTRAAAQLGITFRALRYKLKKLGID